MTNDDAPNYTCSNLVTFVIVERTDKGSGASGDVL